MIFTTDKPYDPIILADELQAALGGNFELSTAGNTLTLQGVDDTKTEKAILKVLKAHMANGDKRAVQKSDAEADSKRIAAFISEADPLFFKEQRKEVLEGTWAAKVAEIRARFPKSTDGVKK